MSVRSIAYTRVKSSCTSTPRNVWTATPVCRPAPWTRYFPRTRSRPNGRSTRRATLVGSRRIPRHREARWRVPSPPRRNGANKGSPPSPRGVPSDADWAGLLGRKVSVRFRLHGEAHPQSETVGVVQSVEGHSGDQTLQILDRRWRPRPGACPPPPPPEGG